MRKITKIIVHCSDSGIPAHDDIAVIRRWHTLPKMPESVRKKIQSGELPPAEAYKYGNGWRDVGYHYFIKADGAIQYGRPIEEMGAHCQGHNRDSIGICLHGKNKFNHKQFVSLRKLVESIDLILNVSAVYGHRDFDKGKTCPNFNVNDALQVYENLTR